MDHDGGSRAFMVLIAGRDSGVREYPRALLSGVEQVGNAGLTAHLAVDDLHGGGLLGATDDVEGVEIRWLEGTDIGVFNVVGELEEVTFQEGIGTGADGKLDLLGGQTYAGHEENPNEAGHNTHENGFGFGGKMRVAGERFTKRQPDGLLPLEENGNDAGTYLCTKSS